MKIKIFLMTLISLLSFSSMIAQETPPTKTPSSVPKPPEPPTLPDPPAPPEAPLPKHKSDTTRINIGDRQVLIIDSKDQKSDEDKANWERELEEAMRELKESFEETEEEMKEAHEEMEEAERDMQRAQDEMDHAENEMNENKSPYKKEKNKFKLKMKKEKKRKAADIGFLDIDLGLNFLRIDGTVSDQLKDDLKLNTWGSWSYTFTFLPTRIYLGTPHLMLLTGLGWRIGHFEFKEKIDFEPIKKLLYFHNNSLKESQFIVHHLQVPLSIYIESKRIKGLGKIGFGLGGYGGILIKQQHEAWTEQPDRFIETNGDFGFEDFRYGLSARLDIGAIKFFANMDMNKLWKDNDFKNIESGIWIDF